MTRPRAVMAFSLDDKEPEVDYGCGCRGCKHRYEQRQAFQKRVMVDICAKYRDLSADEAWRASVAMANAVERALLPFELVKASELELEIVSSETLEEHPEVLTGAPRGATIQ